MVAISTEDTKQRGNKRISAHVLHIPVHAWPRCKWLEFCMDETKDNPIETKKKFWTGRAAWDSMSPVESRTPTGIPAENTYKTTETESIHVQLS